MNRMFCGLAGVLMAVCASACGEKSPSSAETEEEAAMSEEPTTLTILYNNIGGDERCTTAWGDNFVNFGCVAVIKLNSK